jgi:hypothetical protein
MWPSSPEPVSIVRPGPVVWLLAVSLFKAIELAGIVQGHGSTFLYLLQGDLKTIVAAGFLTVGTALARQRVLRSVCWVALAALSTLFLLDALTVLYFDVRPSWRDAGRAREIVEARAFLFRPLTLVTMGSGVGAFFVSIRTTRRIRLALFGGGAALVLLSLVPVAAPAALEKYHVSLLRSLFAEPSQTKSPPYLLREAADAYDHWLEEPSVAKFSGERPPLLLIIVESLSAVDSHRTSGLGTLWPHFDEMTDDGTLFTNFMSAGRSSIDALIALMGGILPCHYPGLGQPGSKTFATSASYVRQLEQRGYFTSYVTGWHLPQKIGWFSLQDYLTVNHFDEAVGRDDPAFRNRSWSNFMPPDGAIFDVARSHLDALLAGTQPFFMTIATVSSHPPYEPSADSKAAKQDPREFVMRYVDRELGRFYQGLRSTRFFERGIMMVLGDHRYWGPLTPPEESRYGDSAIARIPLLVVGKGIPHGKRDPRFFQQQDLLRRLDSLNTPGLVLTEAPVFVEYTTQRGNLSVFSRIDQARVRSRMTLSSGREISWKDPPPKDAAPIEAMIHRQRAALQHLDTLVPPSTTDD